MANVYNKGKANVGSVWDWDADNFKVMLVTSTYTYSAAHNFRADVTNEITNGGYTAGGVALAGETVIEDDTSHQGEYDATDTVFPSLAAGDLPAAAIVYRDTGNSSTDDLVCYCTLTTPPAPDGTDYTIAWHADGVFKLVN